VDIPIVNLEIATKMVVCVCDHCQCGVSYGKNLFPPNLRFKPD